jgi:hypothetical protein
MSSTTSRSPLRRENDQYLLDPTREVGLNCYKTVGAGVDLAWVFGPGTRLLLSYMNERRNQQIPSDRKHTLLPVVPNGAPITVPRSSRP